MSKHKICIKSNSLWTKLPFPKQTHGLVIYKQLNDLFMLKFSNSDYL